MATAKATAKVVDFSNVKDRGNFNPRHIDSGDYEAVIKAVEDQEAKDGEDMWVFTITLPEVPRATYPLYCKLVDNQFWKIKSLFEAAGVAVGKRKLKVDPNKLVGRKIGVFMEDDEYEGKMKSVVQETLPLSEVTGPAEGDVEPEEDDLEEDDIEEEAPKRRTKKAAPAAKRRRQPEPEPEEDEDEEDLEEEEEEPEPPKRRAAAKKAPAKKAPARRRRPAVEEEEDEDELEIDEL